jgi:hypothetical protein
MFEGINKENRRQKAIRYPKIANTRNKTTPPVNNTFNEDSRNLLRSCDWRPKFQHYSRFVLYCILALDWIKEVSMWCISNTTFCAGGAITSWTDCFSISQQKEAHCAFVFQNERNRWADSLKHQNQCSIDEPSIKGTTTWQTENCFADRRSRVWDFFLQLMALFLLSSELEASTPENMLGDFLNNIKSVLYYLFFIC